jgi:ATP-dependent DNA helicase RecG
MQNAFPELKLGLVHGRMKPAEKQAVMAAFSAGELQLLVATTVIVSLESNFRAETCH